jgi:ribosome-associated protein
MRRRELPGGVAPPTKTELKRQARAVQALADRLIAAPADLVDGLGLPDKLADAVALARRIGGGGARVRQRQFVAKLMRGLDLAPLEAALDALANAARLEAARLRRAERWRDRLVEGGEPAIAEFLAECSADREQLARLAGEARRERRGGKPGGAGRRLFRLVQDALAGRGPPQEAVAVQRQRRACRETQAR